MEQWKSTITVQIVKPERFTKKVFNKNFVCQSQFSIISNINHLNTEVFSGFHYGVIQTRPLLFLRNQFQLRLFQSKPFLPEI